MGADCRCRACFRTAASTMGSATAADVATVPVERDPLAGDGAAIEVEREAQSEGRPLEEAGECLQREEGAGSSCRR